MNAVAKKCYLTEMHLFEKHGTYFVFLPYLLRLYEVDVETFNQLDELYKTYGTDQPLDLHIEEFIEAGILYEAEKPLGDLLKIRSEAGSEVESEEEEVIPINDVVLQIANDCNLNCIYCYGDGGSYGRKRELMTLETAKRAIDFMVERSGDLKDLIVVFFGGEPLINFEVVKGAWEYCKSLEERIGKKFIFTMTTNGTILTDEIYHFIKDNHISVMISIDGDKDIQDKHRCYCDGRGSFEDIQKNIERFKEARGGYLTARATVCSTDIRFKKIKDDLLAMGFTNAVTSIVDTSEDSPLFVGGEHTKEVLEQYEILADDYVEGMIAGKKSLNNLFSESINRLYFKRTKIRGCTAGSNSIAVGTDGNVYPCHRFMGMPEYIIGTLDTGIDEAARGKYREATIYNKEGCKTCWARYICCGGCAHTSASHGGLFHAPDCYCDIYKGLYEIVLHTYWRLKEMDDDIFRNRLEAADKTVHTVS